MVLVEPELEEAAGDDGGAGVAVASPLADGGAKAVDQEHLARTSLVDDFVLVGYPRLFPQRNYLVDKPTPLLR